MTMCVSRFITFVTQAAGHSTLYRHVNVVEMRPGAKRLPLSVRSQVVKQILLRTKPLVLDGDDTPGIKAFTRAERCVAALNRMDMAIKAAEMSGPDGVKQLFNDLWELEKDE